MNPLKQLHNAGQSPWLDYIRRSLMTSGELGRMIDEDGLSGLTSNPTIFEKAIAGSSDYDAALDSWVGRVAEPAKIFESLAIEDIQKAADLLLPVYKAAHGRDGFVSLEVSPLLARDTNGTIAEAKRLHKEVDRPNLMIKVPGTVEGVPAFERLIELGISVNVTLLFYVARYEDVIEAYLTGLERRAAAGQSLDPVASVASFFISRIDAAIDQILEQKIASTPHPQDRAAVQTLLGKAAIANARAAYQKFKEAFSCKRFEVLKAKGAQAQRLLWASTGTKNPRYSDVVYVESLIGPQTVNTIPPETWRAFRDHGNVKARLEEDLIEVQEVLAGVKTAGIDLEAVTSELETAGIKSFAQSYEKLLVAIQAKLQTLRVGASCGVSMKGKLGAFEKEVESALRRMEKNRVAERLWAKDPTLWKDDPEHAAIIKNALGWLTIPEVILERASELKALAEEVRQEGFTHVLVLGMGGSSLAPEVFRSTFGPKPDYPTLLVLDSTDPEAVASADAIADPAHTLYIVSSKSGTTTEPLRFMDYFYGRARAVKGKTAGRSFIAITDPGTPLVQQARDSGFRRIFLNAADIGGRYSALSYFGLVPAALMGIDVHELLERAAGMAHACPSCVPLTDNPGLWLGTALGTLAKGGRDKLTFLVSPELASFGLWLEQLIAESTGKEGKGVIPIAQEPLVGPDAYSTDRVFVYIRLESSKDRSLDRLTERLETLGHPVLRLSLKDPLDLGAEFYRWEIATAVLGHWLGIDAFDQPNVQAAKDLTRNLLDRLAKTGSLPALPVQSEDEVLSLSFSKAAAAHLGQSSGKLDAGQGVTKFLDMIGRGDYLGLQVYLSSWGAYQEEVKALREQLLGMTGVPVQMGYGPRYLHSTGQLHKGGPNTGVFIFLVRDTGHDLKIPGVAYSFGQLIGAQSLGDFQALESAGRRALFIRIKGDPKLGLIRLSRGLNSSVLNRRRNKEEVCK